jgi:glycosyltransferase involved in cell wall biosynthesis
MNHPPRSLVVNFNSPELGYLARALAERGRLSSYVRPYANKGRWWERAAHSLPIVGNAYAGTLGRRRIDDERLARLTREAGVLADFGLAALGRWHALPGSLRQNGGRRLEEAIRQRVARAAAGLSSDAECVVAYVGFGLPAFAAIKQRGAGKAVVSYPIAHHRHHCAVQREEHEREPEFAATWRTLAEWPRAYEEQVDREIELADCILVGSSYVRDSFAREGIDAAKIVVAPYGVDLAVFNPGSTRAAQRSKTFNAIFVGQLSQRKGLSYLLRAYRRFRKVDTTLTLVGSAPETQAPLRPYAELFHHVPHQTRPALAQLYRESDVFVFPTLLEGMPLVVLEAMACGLPVIVTANGPGDVVRDGVDGFVVPSRDEEAICDRLERLYRDPELRIEMGSNAYLRAQEFDWPAYANRALDALAALAPGAATTSAAEPRSALLLRAAAR